ncbi:MAG: radical SAM protein [Elusimicrobiota bacterium]
MKTDTPKTISQYWDHISEYEIDDSWRAASESPAYRQYRRKFEAAQKRSHLEDFPLSIEIEASYYCNLKCPSCPRVVNMGEREVGHMSVQLWEKILAECRANGLNAILMDHEAESMMNPRFIGMVKDAKDAGILDIWLHTNANLLTPKKSAELIEAGITKINFSIDAVDDAVYDVLRVGGSLSKVIKNVNEFLRIKLEKKAHHVRTRVSFVEQKENIHQKQAFLDQWKNAPGLNMVTFQECVDFSLFEKPDSEAALSQTQLKAAYKDAEPFHCSLPWEMPVIDTQGNVMPCGSPVREHTKDFILGNLNEGDTIKSCWTGAKMTALRELHRKGEWYLNPVCRVCVKSMRDSKKSMRALRQKAAAKT